MSLDVRYKNYHKNTHYSGNLKARKLVFDTITALLPANVDV
jgi:hypothetical protein